MPGSIGSEGKVGSADAIKRADLPKIEPAKGPTTPSQASEVRKRLPEAPDAKASAGSGVSGKLGSGERIKRADLPEAGPAKGPIDRPTISEIRKRIPDPAVKPGSGAKTQGSETGLAKSPGKGKKDVGRLPEVSGKAGKLPEGRDKALGAKVPGEGKQPGSMKIVGPAKKGPVAQHGGAGTVRARFPERLEKGELDHLTKTALAQKIKLADQYRLAQQGDVARRLALHQHLAKLGPVGPPGKGAAIHGPFAPHPIYQLRGWVSPHYFHHCFHHHFWFGPAWYPRLCWYPRWVPWVRWCWYFRCHPWWDPRPIWCRPYRYVVITQPWVYWEVPVWVTLPTVPCGTWVEVQKVVVPEEQFDLQLLAVRFVDPGHPDEKLGPRYRVWFRNNSSKPISQPFDVLLLATEKEALVQGAPQGGVRVTSIEAGQTQSVDIRLPFEATQMARDPEGKPAPFRYLHVLVDANRQIQDINRANNGTRLAASDVLPVDPAAFEVDPTTVAAGGEVVLAGEGLGPEPGKVLVHLGNIELEAEILGWYDLGVRLKVPELPLADATQADLVVVRGDGAATNPLTITVNPPQRPVPSAPPEGLPKPEMNAPASP